MLPVATQPHFCAPLPDTPPREVQLQVDSLLYTASVACPDAPHNNALQLWLHTRALDWVVHNAPGFIMGSAREQALPGKLQRRIIESALQHMPDNSVKQVKEYHDVLLNQRGGMARPVLMSSHKEFLDTMKDVVRYEQEQLALTRMFDILILNVHYLSMMPAPERRHFAKVIVSKWKESVETWGLFAALYPWHHLAPILAMTEGVDDEATN